MTLGLVASPSYKWGPNPWVSKWLIPATQELLSILSICHMIGSGSSGRSRTRVLSSCSDGEREPRGHEDRMADAYLKCSGHHRTKTHLCLGQGLGGSRTRGMPHGDVTWSWGLGGWLGLHQGERGLSMQRQLGWVLYLAYCLLGRSDCLHAWASPCSGPEALVSCPLCWLG